MHSFYHRKPILHPETILEKVYGFRNAYPDDALTGIRIMTIAEYQPEMMLNARETNTPLLVIRREKAKTIYHFYGDPKGDGKFKWEIYRPNSLALNKAFKALFATTVRINDFDLVKSLFDEDHVLFPILNQYHIIEAEKQSLKNKSARFRLRVDLKGNGLCEWKTYVCRDPALVNLVDKLLSQLTLKIAPFETKKAYKKLIEENVKFEFRQNSIHLYDKRLQVPLLNEILRKGHHALYYYGPYPEYEKLKKKLGEEKAKIIALVFNEIYKESSLFPRNITQNKEKKIVEQVVKLHNIFKNTDRVKNENKKNLLKHEKELFQIADGLESKFLKNNWTLSKRPLHKIVWFELNKMTIKKNTNHVPRRIKKMVDKIQDIKQQKTENSIDTTLKQLACSALFAAQKKKKNFFDEQKTFDKMTGFIDYKATFEEILNKINKTNFIIIGRPQVINNKEMTCAIRDIFEICKNKNGHDEEITLSNGKKIKNDPASKLFYILNLAKQKTEEPRIFHLFRHIPTTHEFYKTLDRCIVLRNTSELHKIMVDINGRKTELKKLP